MSENSFTDGKEDKGFSRRDFIKNVSVGAAGAISLIDNNVLIYGGGGQGKVIFDHQTHVSYGITCKDCHFKPF